MTDKVYDPDPVGCGHCDFSMGTRGMDRCHHCDGIGSIFRVGTKRFYNTREGYLAAIEEMKRVDAEQALP